MSLNANPIKVIYDISVLGQGHRHLRARTGVFRVVESLAEGLANSPECDLVFCVSQYFELLDSSVNYLEASSKFKDIPLLHSSFTITFYKKLVELYNTVGLQLKISESNPSSTNHQLLNELKKSLESSIMMMGGSSGMVNEINLSEGDIYHSPYDAIPQTGKQTKMRKFITIYDLIPILYPQFLLNENIPILFNNTLNSISEDDWVICDSHSTKNDLCNHLKKINHDRVFVTHLAASPTIFYRCYDSEKQAETCRKYRIPDGLYVLSLGTLEPRKNIDHLIRCFAKLIQEQKIIDLYLVLVGTPGWKYEKIIEEVSKQDFLKERIIFTGYVPEHDLAALYSGALVFVYPSFYEGFGLPPLEAMQCGVPVITSNTSSLPEVVGDAGTMLDPKDTDGLCHSILELYNRPSLRETMSERALEQAKKFSWERCTQETIGAYKTALAS